VVNRAFRIPLPAWVQDVLLAGFVTVMQIQGTQQAASNSDVVTRPLTDFGNLGYVLLTLSGLVLVVRRRWPVAVFATTAAVSLVYFTADFSDGPVWIGLFVALYTLTSYGDGRRSLRVAAVGIAVLAVVWLVLAADIQPTAALGWVFFRIGASVMAAALGESVRSRRVIAAEAEERARLAERTREDEARRRVDAERLRIAREVHDTVAHAIAIINVQAGVTAHVLDKRPERARETLVTIEETSAQALREMRATLGVLRGTDDDTPSLGLDQVDELAAMARESGLDVKVEVGSGPRELPSAVDRAAYRILQESITNVIRHAGPARVTIRIEYGPNELKMRVTDDGRGRGDVPAGAAVDAGRGIVGMKERCASLGGELRAGPLEQRGYEVVARLPLRPVKTVHQ
jgi:signal transduction histidine kinase